MKETKYCIIKYDNEDKTWNISLKMKDENFVNGIHLLYSFSSYEEALKFSIILETCVENFILFDFVDPLDEMEMV
jgi:hypothetical protein